MKEIKYQVFISSTYTDLIDERQAAVEAVLESGNIPAGMEQFTSGNIAQWELIKNWIKQSDIYMLIIGCRYGTKHPKSHRSYTEMEYMYAKKINKPIFALLASSSFIENKIKDGFVDIHSNDYFLLIKFKSVISKKIVNYFDNRDQIKLFTVRSLNEICDKINESSGWVKNYQTDHCFSDIDLLFSRHWIIGQGTLPDIEEKHNYLAIKKMAKDHSDSTIYIGSPHMSYWTQPSSETRIEWLLKNTKNLKIELVLYIPTRKIENDYIDNRNYSVKIFEKLLIKYKDRINFVNSKRCIDISYIIYQITGSTVASSRALIGLQTNSYQARPFLEFIYLDKDIPPMVGAVLEIHKEGISAL